MRRRQLVSRHQRVLVSWNACCKHRRPPAGTLVCRQRGSYWVQRRRGLRGGETAVVARSLLAIASLLQAERERSDGRRVDERRSVHAETIPRGLMNRSSISIGTHTIGAGHPCFVIAEAGINHNGDVNIAAGLVAAAASAGADAIKFQTHFP